MATLQNPLNRIKDITKRKQIIEICSRLQILHQDKTISIDKVLQEMALPISYHLFITANFSELMALKYTVIPSRQ